MSKNTFKLSPSKIVLQLAGYAVAGGLLWWLFTEKLPKIMSPQDVLHILDGLSFSQISLLVLSGLLLIVALGWTSRSTLPGVSLLRATEASVAAQATSVVLPAPFDLLMRLRMYSSYGFSTSKSTAAVVVAGIARYFALVAVPLAGIITLIMTGEATARMVRTLVIALPIVVFAAFLMRRIFTNDVFAKYVARLLQRASNAVLGLIKRPPSVKLYKSVLNFSENVGQVIQKNIKELTWSHVAWGLGQFLVLYLSIRMCGITDDALSAAQVLFITGAMLVLNSVPFIPGGIGFSEVILLSLVTFGDDRLTAAFASALLLYRIMTWLLPIPIGIGALLWWRVRMANSDLHGR